MTYIYILCKETKLFVLFSDIQYLLKYLEQICGRVGDLQENYLFVREVLWNKGLSGQVKVHKKLDNWSSSHPAPADNNAFQILYEVLGCIFFFKDLLGFMLVIFFFLGRN